MLRIRALRYGVLILSLGASACSVLDSRPVFRYRAGPISTLDPAAASDHASLREAARAYQTPMRLERAFGKIVTRPWLIEKSPRVTDRGRTWELVFKSGVRFQERRRLFRGKPRDVSSCDWVRSILRHGDPRVGSHWVAYLSNRIEGFREWTTLAKSVGNDAYSQFPKGLACSGNSATIRLKFPDSEFSYFLAHPASSVLPVPEILRENWNVQDDPVGSGSYVMAGSRTGTLRWKSRDQLSPVKTLSVDTSLDSFRDWDLFMRGSLDIIELPTDFQTQLLEPSGVLAEKWKDRGFQLLKIQRADLVFIGFQNKHPILGTKRGVRQALAKALDHGFVIERVFSGRAIDAESPIPPGIRGYVPPAISVGREGDLGPAQDLLGFNDYPRGRGLPKFTMACLANPVEQELCRAIVARWELLGVQTRIVTMDERQRRAGILDGSIHFWPVTWVADLPGPISYLEFFDPATGLPEIPAPLSDLASFRRALSK
ncbi:hypothetical protein EBZ37_10745, partial [bacterium]|nr:hypothetical protein [bacterium]